MKFLHLSDLHLGKRLKGYSLLEDQRYILEQIIGIVKAEKPQAVIIAGDIYDTAVPSVEAVSLCDRFLTELHECQTKVIAVSGNHDNAMRIAFGAELMHKSEVYLSPVYDGKMSSVTLQDEVGPVNFYLMPFLRCGEIKRCHPEANIDTYTDAIRTVVEAAEVNWDERNVVVSHQYVTGAVLSSKQSDTEQSGGEQTVEGQAFQEEALQVQEIGEQSSEVRVPGEQGSGEQAALNSNDLPMVAEEERIGNMDGVSRQAYAGFEYVALGHLHTPQYVGVPTVRYCGTPLKYSLAEIWADKTVTVVEMGPKGSEVQVRTVPLVPRHDSREIKGKLAELLKDDFDPGDHEDYLYVLLTDEGIQYEAFGHLRQIYPNILSLDYAKPTQAASVTAMKKVKELSPAEVFAVFFKERMGKEMSAEQAQLVDEIMEDIFDQENSK